MHWRPAAVFTVTRQNGKAKARKRKTGKNWWKVPTTTLDEIRTYDSSPNMVSSVQVGCMRQVLGAGALGRPRGMGWGGRWEGGSGWGTHVNPWLIPVIVWQKPLQYCKIISPQLTKINGKKII